MASSAMPCSARWERAASASSIPWLTVPGGPGRGPGRRRASPRAWCSRCRDRRAPPRRARRSRRGSSSRWRPTADAALGRPLWPGGPSVRRRRGGGTAGRPAWRWRWPPGPAGGEPSGSRASTGRRRKPRRGRRLVLARPCPAGTWTVAGVRTGVRPLRRPGRTSRRSHRGEVPQRLWFRPGLAPTITKVCSVLMHLVLPSAGSTLLVTAGGVCHRPAAGENGAPPRR
jgi:hypothetical protein